MLRDESLVRFRRGLRHVQPLMRRRLTPVAATATTGGIHHDATPTVCSTQVTNNAAATAVFSSGARKWAVLCRYPSLLVRTCVPFGRSTAPPGSPCAPPLPSGVLKSYSTAFFEAARRKKARVRAGFPRRKRGLVPVRFHLRPFVLGDDTLHLGEQPGLGIVIKGGGVREQHRHTVAGQLVEHDHLVGGDPGEAIRRQAPYGVEEPRLGRVTKSIEVGAIQA